MTRTRTTQRLATGALVALTAAGAVAGPAEAATGYAVTDNLGTQTVSGTPNWVATPNQQTTRVEFLVDGSRIDTEYNAPYETLLRTSALTVGKHTLLVRAYHRDGTRATTGEVVTVSRTTAPAPAPTPAPTPAPAPAPTPAPAPFSTFFSDVLLSSSARWEVTRSSSTNTVTYGADGATFTIPGGSSSSNRVELQAETSTGATFKTYPGDDRYVGVDIRLHAGYPSGTGGGSGFNLLMQWKDWDAGGESASPPVSLAVEGGQYRLRGGATQDRMPCRQTFSHDLAPMDNLNHRWVFHVYNGRPGVGYVEVWRDGVKLRDKVYPPCGTVYPEPTDALMHRIGMYRGGGITARGTVTYRDYKMTDTYASAAAR